MPSAKRAARAGPPFPAEAAERLQRSRVLPLVELQTCEVEPGLFVARVMGYRAAEQPGACRRVGGREGLGVGLPGLERHLAAQRDQDFPGPGRRSGSREGDVEGHVGEQALKRGQRPAGHEGRGQHASRHVQQSHLEDDGIALPRHLARDETKGAHRLGRADGGGPAEPSLPADRDAPGPTGGRSSRARARPARAGPAAARRPRPPPPRPLRPREARAGPRPPAPPRGKRRGPGRRRRPFTPAARSSPAAWPRRGPRTPCGPGSRGACRGRRPARCRP